MAAPAPRPREVKRLLATCASFAYAEKSVQMYLKGSENLPGDAKLLMLISQLNLLLVAGSSAMHGYLLSDAAGLELLPEEEKKIEASHEAIDRIFSALQQYTTELSSYYCSVSKQVDGLNKRLDALLVCPDTPEGKAMMEEAQKHLEGLEGYKGSSVPTVLPSLVTVAPQVPHKD